MRTKPQALTAPAIFTRLILWSTLIALVLISISSAWTYYSMNQLMQITQERREVALGKGLALAIGDLIAIRGYAELETNLQQIMGNEAIRSVAVADTSGNVLALLERKPGSDRASPNFSISKLSPPETGQESYLIQKEADTTVLWYKVDFGIPLGWIRMESSKLMNDELLENLRRNILLSVFVLFLGLFISSMLLVYQAKRKAQRAELRLIRHNETLQDAAYLDTLTKLPNRLSLERLLEAAIDQSKENSQMLAICFLDLDGFKAVNDQLGHQAGDKLLIAAAGRMKKAIRETDSVIRLAGDEFVLLLGGLKDLNELDASMRRILELIAAPFMIDEQRVSISASIGVSIYPNDTCSINDLVDHADTAMYEAKNKGKNAWVLFQPRPR